MADSPLYVSFIWHMHQPYYRDPLTGIYRLPWVRLHGCKDYLDMLDLLRDFPGIRQTFNVVPSLIDQVIDYAEHQAYDVHLDISRKKASDLTLEEKVFTLENFFLAHWDNMIKPFSRYYELLVKRGTQLSKSEISRCARYFSDQEFLDLQVLFNLCWIDPYYRRQSSFLTGLIEKGRNFTEDEKNLLLDFQITLLKQIVPSYKAMAQTGQVELSVTPYYHPILPLLCDTDISRIGMPQVRLPRQRFAHPEDAGKQIDRGIRFFEEVFGFSPRGMWPSEGSVSEEVLRIIASHGIQWVATDEGVLSNTLKRQLRDGNGTVIEPGLLYRPYVFEGVSVIFRDHSLSDLIGFVYSQWDSKRASDDLIQRLLHIRNTLPSGFPHLVSIILDGENAWEHYQNDGRDFFMHLYAGLSRENRIRTVTVSEYLQDHYRGDRLDSLFPGSWINSNFGIWIGHEEDNTSWDYLTETRNRLVAYENEHPDADTRDAWKSIYIAEGSDWNWWYGDEHSTETAEEFDELFRFNLMNVYRIIGVDVPSQLYVPVLRHDRSISPALTVRGFITPKIDGIVSSYYEWYQGAQIDVSKSGGSMHKSDSLLSQIYYGFNRDSLYLRLDPQKPFSEFQSGLVISVVIAGPSEFMVTFPLTAGIVSAELFEKVKNAFIKLKDIQTIAVQDIVEIGIRFQDIGVREKDEINLFFSLSRDMEEVERCPWRGFITITVPTEDFEAIMWS